MQNRTLTWGRLNSMLAYDVLLHPHFFSTFSSSRKVSRFTACIPITTSIPELSAETEAQCCRKVRQRRKVSREVETLQASQLQLCYVPLKAQTKCCNNDFFLHLEYAWCAATPLFGYATSCLPNGQRCVSIGSVSFTVITAISIGFRAHTWIESF